MIRRLGTLTWLRHYVRSVRLKLFGWIQQNGEVRKHASLLLSNLSFLIIRI